MSWADRFVTFAAPPSQTEKEKCENAESMVRQALRDDPIVRAMDVSVFAQGSYRNRTNVRQNSDVDICVRLNSTFFPDYPTGKTREDFGNLPGSITFADYKNRIEAALMEFFGSAGVTRGNKAFDVHANTYRVDADVVPTMEHRRYTGRLNADGSHQFYSGIGFNTDAGQRVINWPEQAYANGVQKHTDTGKRFKKIVRILKRLRDEMSTHGVDAAQGIPSCLIESLVWNVDNQNFGAATYYDDVRAVLIAAYNATNSDAACAEWKEMSGMKWLFRSTTQPWTRQKANSFLVAVWGHVGFRS